MVNICGRIFLVDGISSVNIYRLFLNLNEFKEVQRGQEGEKRVEDEIRMIDRGSNMLGLVSYMKEFERRRQK